MANVLRQNPIGQVADGVVEQLKSTGSQAVGQVITEPAKILEQILGGESTAVERGQSVATTASPSPTDDASLLARKQQESQESAAALYKLHQQRIAEEKQYYQEHKQEEAQKKQVEVREINHL